MDAGGTLRRDARGLKGVAHKACLAAAADAAHVGRPMWQDALQDGGVAQVAVGEHDHVVAARDAHQGVKVLKRAAGHGLRLGEERRVADARAVVHDVHAEAHGHQHRHQGLAHVAAAKDVADGLGAHGFHVAAGALVPGGDVAGAARRVLLAAQAPGGGLGVAPVLLQPAHAARGQKLLQLGNNGQLGGRDQAHGQEGVAAAGHGVLLVGHPLQGGRGGRGGRGLLACGGRRGEELRAAALGYELDVAAAHGAHPGAVGQA